MQNPKLGRWDDIHRPTTSAKLVRGGQTSAPAPKCLGFTGVVPSMRPPVSPLFLTLFWTRGDGVWYGSPRNDRRRTCASSARYPSYWRSVR